MGIRMLTSNSERTVILVGNNQKSGTDMNVRSALLITKPVGRFISCWTCWTYKVPP